jgi:hypothetical protein
VETVDADYLLDELERESHDTAGEAMAVLALAVQAINRELDEEEPDEERIRELVQRLHDAARKVADKFNARGFSISVGFPLGVAVSVDW